MFVGPVPGLPGKLCFNIYQGQNDFAKPQSMGFISAMSLHCTSDLFKKITKKEHFKHKDKNKKKKNPPWFP